MSCKHACMFGCVEYLKTCSHQRTRGCIRAEAARHVPDVLDSCWSPDSRLNTPGRNNYRQKRRKKERSTSLKLDAYNIYIQRPIKQNVTTTRTDWFMAYYRRIVTLLFKTQVSVTWFQKGYTSLLSAGPRARSYRLFGATFPTASRNLELVITFTLNFLHRRWDKYIIVLTNSAITLQHGISI